MCDDIERELQLNYEAMDSLRAEASKGRNSYRKSTNKKRKYRKTPTKVKMLTDMQECVVKVKRSRR